MGSVAVAPVQHHRGLHHPSSRNHPPLLLRFRRRELIPCVLLWILVLLSANVYFIQNSDKHKHSPEAEDKVSRLEQYQKRFAKRGQQLKQQPDVVANDNNNPEEGALPHDEQPKQERKEEFDEKQQQQQQQQHYVIFSTSCDYGNNHDWLSYLFFYQAMKMDQPGEVWRIVSGCNSEQEKEMQGLFDSLIQPMSQNFHMHFTPQFGREKTPEWQSTKYWNKPFGVHHWLENVLGYPNSKEHDNDVVILLDPDMVLMRPFINDFSEFPIDVWTSHNRKKAQEQPLLTKVSAGKPMAQDYNFGEAWYEAAAKNLTHVVGPDSPIHKLSREDARVLYSGGPPYVFTAKDMHQVTKYWTLFLPRLFDVFPKFMAEMYGFCLATAHLQMPQQLARGFMISNVVMDQGEGWYFLKDVAPEQICHPTPKKDIPHVLHFCQRYSIGDFFISKYTYPDLIQCDTPLLRLPEPDSAVRYNFSHYGDGTTDYWPEKKLNLKYKNAFMVCMLLPAINDAAKYYKKNHCSEGANYDETWEYFASKEWEKKKKKTK